jgi:hypothetical protein
MRQRAIWFTLQSKIWLNNSVSKELIDTLSPKGDKMSRNRSIGLIVLGIVLLAGFAILASSLGWLTASADSNSVNVNFIKWITTPGTAPVKLNMAGVVSGDVGGGQFVGEVLDITNLSRDITKIHALYHVNGGAHQFTADLQVTQKNSTSSAVIEGTITNGWMKGAQVQGEYQVVNPCGIINAQNGVAGDVCFQGTLRIEQESKR